MVVFVIGAEVATVWVAWYDSVVGGNEVVTDASVTVEPSAAPPSPPAHTPAAITAIKTAAATPTGSHRAASLSRLRPPDPGDPPERELAADEEPLLPWLRLPRCAGDVDVRGGGLRLVTGWRREHAGEHPNASNKIPQPVPGRKVGRRQGAWLPKGAWLR